jgi:hypothetical protein
MSQARPPATSGITAPRILGLLALVLLIGDVACADFLVQPMILRRTLSPGVQRPTELKLENVDPTNAEKVTLRIAEYTQIPDGRWVEMFPGDPNLATANLRSCRTWLSVPSAPIDVPPYKVIPFTLQINVPPQTNGFYFAAIVATTEARMVSLEGTLAPVNMELVVPIILEIQNQPVRREVSLTNAGLHFEPKVLAKPAANKVTIDITNAGGTFSSLNPVARLWGQTEGGHWTRVAEVRFPELIAMPGAKLHLTQDVGRLLASGTYRVEAFLFVDGQRGDRKQKDISFVGDNIVGPVKTEISLDVQPNPASIQAVPGSTRSTFVEVINRSQETVNVEAQLILPPHMLGIVNGRGIRGEDLGCADWVTVAPTQFSLRGYAKRNVGLLVRMPKDGMKYPTYYGTLRLRVTYADGTPAGMKTAPVCIEYKQGTGTTLLKPTVLTVSETNASRYLVTAAYSNMGETYVKPVCEGILSKPGVGGGAASILKRFLMTSEAYGQTGVMLPFDARVFSGALDVSDVDPGTYYVTSALNWEGGPTNGLQEQRIIIVEEQGGRKVARMAQPTGAAPVPINLM